MDPLFQIAERDPSTICRIAALDSISRLALDQDSLQRLVAAAEAVLDTDGLTREQRAALFRIGSRIPDDSFRQRLIERRARDASERLFVAGELATHGNVLGVPVLMDALESPGAGWAAERLACLPIENLNVSRAPFQRVLREARDPDLRLWGCLALARLGETRPLERGLRTLLDPEGRELPGMFHGDPWTPFHRLAAARPLPAEAERVVRRFQRDALNRGRQSRLVRMLIEIMRPDVRRDVIGDASSEGELPRAAAIAVRALVGEMEDARDTAAETGSAEPAEEAAEPDHEDLHALADEVIHSEKTWDVVRLGNELLSRSRSARAGLDPVKVIGAAVAARRELPAPVAWVLARRPPERLVAAVGRMAQEESDPLRRALTLGSLGTILAWRDQPAPYAGAGGGSGPAVPKITELAGEAPDAAAAAEPAELAMAAPESGPKAEPPDTHATPRSAADEPPPDPPRRNVWPHLACDDAVVVNVAFPLEVGIAASRGAGVVTAGSFGIPTGAVMIDVEIHVDPSAFEIVEGKPRVRLDVQSSGDFPRHTLQLKALPGEDLNEIRTISAIYTMGQVVCGTASRQVRVVATQAELGPPRPAATPEGVGGIDLSPLSLDEDVDLTIVIARGEDTAGRTLMFALRGAGVSQPDPKAMRANIGQEPAQFLREIIKRGSATAGNNAALDLFLWLVGTGRQIWEKFPRPVRQAIQAAAQRSAPNPPTILILSADPYVPWELAVPESALQPGAKSPFLGAQAVIGRWILDAERPPIRPPRTGAVREAVVVHGDYTDVAGWLPLQGAIEEATELLARNWRPLDASPPAVLGCLKGGPGADLLHFAVHGKYGNPGAERGLILVEQGPDAIRAAFCLAPQHVQAYRFQRTPFVFLNACQVAGSDEVLGDYTGMAKSFLVAGALAVVAPLWSIDDKAAKQIALEFYDCVLDQGQSPAEVFLRERQRFCEETVNVAGAPASLGTYVAYQYFGHPRMKLTN